MGTEALVTNTKYNQLMDEILERHLHLADHFEVAALLESMGWNDSRVAEIFNLADVFELALSLWNQLQSKLLSTTLSKAEKLSFKRKQLWDMMNNFFRGTIFALPMAVSVISMITLKFSLWSYENLSTDLATSIAIGTILSFVSVGGFTQAIARRGFFYITQGHYNMGRRVTFHFIGLGFLVCIICSISIFLFNSLFHIYPYYMLSLIILFFFFLTSIWLSVTVMYILKKEVTFTGLIISGIAIVYLLFVVLKMNIILSQLIALFIVSVAGLLLVLYYFKREEKKAEKGDTVPLPKMSVAVYSVMPYFLYGFFYFSFLFIDRVNAWSANTKFMPYLIWFRGEYELGLDFALLLLVIPMGVSEVIVSKLMLDLEMSQKKFFGQDTEKLNALFLKNYYKGLVIISITAMICAVCLYYGAQFIYEHFSLSIGNYLFSNPVTHFVFSWAIVSYAIVCLGLMNAVILFSLSQPNMIVRSIIPAFAVNGVIGFLLSRWIDYDYAIFGLLAGTIVFAILSSIKLVQVIKKLDYYLFASS